MTAAAIRPSSRKTTVQISQTTNDPIAENAPRVAVGGPGDGVAGVADVHGVDAAGDLGARLPGELAVDDDHAARVRVAQGRADDRRGAQRDVAAHGHDRVPDGAGDGDVAADGHDRLDGLAARDHDGVAELDDHLALNAGLRVVGRDGADALSVRTLG